MSLPTSYPPNLIPTSGAYTVLPRFPTTEEVVLVNNQIVLATGFVEETVTQSLDDGLDKVVATLNIDARNVNSLVTVQAQTALAVSATGAATPVAKYFIINGVATQVVGYFCPDATVLNGGSAFNWEISGMAQSLEIPAGDPIVIQWVLGGADVGCELTTGYTTVMATITPSPVIIPIPP